MKKILALLLCAATLGSCVLSGCTSEGGSSATENAAPADPIEGIEAKRSDDKYRNYYQIFVHSFCDSNDDQTGDLEGIISQLDYLNDGDPNSGDDLGVDGIWLTPIMPSKSYHKYDVKDYYDIDPDFGTLETFDKLIEECDKRGINVIIDLVLNHISSEHPLYLQAVEEVSEGKLDGAAKYFEIHKGDYFTQDVPVNVLSNGYVCEANFSPEMPEWNLSSEDTRAEFEKIAKFWLDRGVAGFRLDACRYYGNKETDATEFMKWFYTTCQKIKPDVYMVGENWVDDSEIEALFESGIDSQFAFKFATTAGLIMENIMTQTGSAVVSKVMHYEEKMREHNENQINTLFLSNHDQMRSGNSLEGKSAEAQKLAAAVYMLFPGNPFIYYGEEIGVKAPNTTNDAAYRTPMIFDSENLPMIYVNSIGDEAEAPTGGGVKQQLENKNSLLNYYRRIIKIKNQNPELARGQITGIPDIDDRNIGAFYTEYEGSKLLVIHNFSGQNEKEITITEEMMPNAVVRADLVPADISKHVELKDGKLTLPVCSTVILKTAE